MTSGNWDQNLSRQTRLAGIMRFQKIPLCDCSFPALSYVILRHTGIWNQSQWSQWTFIRQICISLELTEKFKRKNTVHVWRDESSLFSPFPTFIWLFSPLLRSTLSILLCLVPLTMLYNTVAVEEKVEKVKREVTNPTPLMESASIPLFHCLFFFFFSTFCMLLFFFFFFGINSQNILF